MVVFLHSLMVSFLDILMVFFLLINLKSMGKLHLYFIIRFEAILHQIILKKNHYSLAQEILMIFIFQMAQYFHVIFDSLFFYLKDLIQDANLFLQLNSALLLFSLVLMIFQFDLVFEKYHLSFIVPHSIFQNIHLFDFFEYAMIGKHIDLYLKNSIFGLLLSMLNFFSMLFNFLGFLIPTMNLTYYLFLLTVNY